MEKATKYKVNSRKILLWSIAPTSTLAVLFGIIHLASYKYCGESPAIFNGLPAELSCTDMTPELFFEAIVQPLLIAIAIGFSVGDIIVLIKRYGRIHPQIRIIVWSIALSLIIGFGVGLQAMTIPEMFGALLTWLLIGLLSANILVRLPGKSKDN